jgi:hypothetical protein
MPTPPAAPSTSSVSPDFRFARSCSAWIVVAVGQQRGRADLERDVGGQRHHRLLGDDDPLGVRAVQHRRGDAIADGHRGDAGADRADHAGDLPTGRERQRGLELVLAVGLQHVGEVDAGGADVDHDVAIGDRGIRHLVDAQAGGTDELVDADSLHAAS